MDGPEPSPTRHLPGSAALALRSRRAVHKLSMADQEAIELRDKNDALQSEMAEVKQERDRLRNEVTTLWSKLSKVRSRPAGPRGALVCSYSRRTRPARSRKCGESARARTWPVPTCAHPRLACPPTRPPAVSPVRLSPARARSMSQSLNMVKPQTCCVLTDVVRGSRSDASATRPSAEECHRALKRITLARLQAEANAQHEHLSASRALLESSLQGLQPADYTRRQAEIEAYAAQAEHDMADLRAAHELAAEANASELVPYMLVSQYMATMATPSAATTAAMPATAALPAAMMMPPLMMGMPPMMAMSMATPPMLWAMPPVPPATTTPAQAPPERGSDAEDHGLG
jgi:FtsZ-binding cell division protein ZapB